MHLWSCCFSFGYRNIALTSPRLFLMCRHTGDTVTRRTGQLWIPCQRDMAPDRPQRYELSLAYQWWLLKKSLFCSGLFVGYWQLGQQKGLIEFCFFCVSKHQCDSQILKRQGTRAIWVCFVHCALLIKNTWVTAKGIVMLATWPLQTKPGTQADLKFKAYLVWEHLLKKMSFVFKIITCNFSRTVFHLIGFVLAEEIPKRQSGTFVCAETRWPPGTQLGFVEGYTECKRQVF